MQHSTQKIRNICVYCGASSGNNPLWQETAIHLAKSMAGAGIGLVYGGGNTGIMGLIARTMLASGGRVTGIIPHFLKDRELLLESAHEIIITKDMHERKAMMCEKADAFVALPGGIGTLEELVEQLTWVQLQQHQKPILMANIEGFWDPLLSLLDHMREAGFIHNQRSLKYLIAKRAEDILPMLLSAQQPIL